MAHAREWIPSLIPVTYLADDLDHDSVFKYLGVYIDANNRYLRQYKDTLDTVRCTCDNATYKQASVETITTVMLVSPFWKASYPSKYYPWSNR